MDAARGCAGGDSTARQEVGLPAVSAGADIIGSSSGLPYQEQGKAEIERRIFMVLPVRIELTTSPLPRQRAAGLSKFIKVRKMSRGHTRRGG